MQDTSGLRDHKDLSYIRLAVNAVESVVEYYLLQRQTNKAKESILGQLETSVLACITKR